MANELEFILKDGDIEVSGYNEIHQKTGDDVYYLDSHMVFHLEIIHFVKIMVDNY